MIDELREESELSAFLDEIEQESEVTVDDVVTQEKRSPFLGLTPIQRMLLSFMLLFMVCIFGSICLLVFGKVVPPL
jgi:hypothetical protein